ncbi:MAG: DUF5678 domain-containing protein [Anaerolineae bacterium]
MAEVKEKEILLSLERFSEDVDWVSKKQATLRKKLAGKYVAVARSRVIDSDSKLETLLERLKEKAEDPGQIVIEFISPEPPRLIL